MKRNLILSIALFFAFGVMAQEQAVPQSKAQISFTEKSKDFGDIFQGDKVTHIFKFKNTGTDPLILSNVITTCGCTATDWPKEPIMPGAEAEIKATFNSAGKMGNQNKVITVVSNSASGSERVSIIANVLPPKSTVITPQGQ